MAEIGLPGPSAKRSRGRSSSSSSTKQAASGEETVPMAMSKRSMHKRLVAAQRGAFKSFPEKMSCILCNIEVDNRESLEHHYMSLHTRVWKPDFPEGVDNNASLTTILKKLGCLRCQSCQKEFKGVQYYKFHREWCGREWEEAVCDMCNKTQKAMWMGHHRRTCSGGTSTKNAKLVEIIPSGQRRSAALRALETLDALKDGGDAGNEPIPKEDVYETPREDISSESNDENDAVIAMDEGDGDGDAKSSSKESKSSRKDLSRLPRALRKVNKFCFRIHMEYYLVAESANRCPTWLPFDGAWTYDTGVESSVGARFYRDCILSTEPLRLQYCYEQEKCGHVVEPLQSAVCSDEIFCCNITAPIAAMAWCPIPLTAEPQQQYLALALRYIREYDDHYSHPSAIQLWDFGFLEKSNDTCPSCVMMIKHVFGQLWDMKWCPFGAWQPNITATEKAEKRLGMLAVAASDGNAYILSVPNPSTIKTIALPCILAVPQIVVKLSGGLSPCMCVDWQAKGAGIVAAGYADGTVCLWSLENEVQEDETVINNDIVLEPYECFPAQSSHVRVIRWCPNSPYLFATVSLLERCISIWDIRDLGTPHTTIDQHGTTPTDLDWGSYYDGVFVTSDDICKVNGENLLHFFECGYLGLPPRPIQTTYSTTWSLSVCNWSGCIASSNDQGSVFLTPLPNAYKSRKTADFRLYEVMKLKNLGDHSGSTTSVELVMSNVSTLGRQHKPQKPASETVKCYSSRGNAKFLSVRFNPNPGCHTWLAAASDCGLLVVTSLRSTSGSHHQKTLFEVRARNLARLVC